MISSEQLIQAITDSNQFSPEEISQMKEYFLLTGHIQLTIEKSEIIPIRGINHVGLWFKEKYFRGMSDSPSMGPLYENRTPKEKQPDFRCELHEYNDMIFLPKLINHVFNHGNVGLKVSLTPSNTKSWKLKKLEVNE